MLSTVIRKSNKFTHCKKVGQIDRHRKNGLLIQLSDCVNQPKNNQIKIKSFTVLTVFPPKRITSWRAHLRVIAPG